MYLGGHLKRFLPQRNVSMHYPEQNIQIIPKFQFIQGGTSKCDNLVFSSSFFHNALYLFWPSKNVFFLQNCCISSIWNHIFDPNTWFGTQNEGKRSTVIHYRSFDFGSKKSQFPTSILSVKLALKLFDKQNCHPQRA